MSVLESGGEIDREAAFGAMGGQGHVALQLLMVSVRFNQTFDAIFPAFKYQMSIFLPSE